MQSLAVSWVTRIACAVSVDPNSDILGGGLVHPQLVDQPSIFPPCDKGSLVQYRETRSVIRHTGQTVIDIRCSILKCLVPEMYIDIIRYSDISW